MSSDLAFVLRGKNRTAVIKALLEGPKVVTAIRQKTGIHKSHITRVIKPLLERKLLRCSNPREKTLRIYELTQKGKRVAKEVKKYTFA